MQPKENQSLCSTCPDKFTHILISVSPSSDLTQFWKSLVRLWEGRQLLEPCRIWPPFLYHPASFLALKGYSRRDTWRISYSMMVAKQQVSSRATPLCSGLCQTKHFSPSPPINEPFSCSVNPSACSKTNCQNKGVSVSGECGAWSRTEATALPEVGL